MKKILAILAACAVLGGGITAGVALRDRGPDVPVTAVTAPTNVTIAFLPHEKYGHSVEVRWGPELFWQASDVFNYDLALVAAALSAAASDGDKDNGYYIVKAYQDLKIPSGNITLYSYPDNPLSVTKIGSSRKDNPYYIDALNAIGDSRFNDHSLAFSIASTEIGNENLLIVTLRGTDAFGDEITDGNMIGSTSFLGADTHKGFHEFFVDAQTGLKEYFGRHSDLMNKPLKILVTGHSLGGAAANLLAAWFNSEECDYANEANVFSYTMAAPFNHNGDKAMTTECKNIFNVVNTKDPVPMLKKASDLAKYTTGNPFLEFIGMGSGFSKRYGADLQFSEGDKMGMDNHAQQLYVAMVKEQRETNPVIAKLEADYAASQRAEAEARSAAEAESLRQVEEAARRRQQEAEEVAAQRADDAIKAKLTKLATEANSGAAWGSLFSLGTLETQVCAFGESRTKYGLIYKYQYTYNVVDTESERRNLQSTVNMQSAVYQQAINQMRREGIPNPVVRAQYLNRDGSVIYEQEFS